MSPGRADGRLDVRCDVLGFAGSLRKGSYNRMALRAAEELLPDGMTLAIFDITPIPLYNEDRTAIRVGAGEPAAHKALIRALARAHRWQLLFEKGTYRSVAEVGDAEGVTRSFVNRMMRLTLLAPDIVEAIPEGRRPKGLLLEASTGQPANWPKPKASSPACCGSPSGAAYR